MKQRRRPGGGSRTPIRLEGGRGGASLSETLSNGMHRLAWRTPLHRMRLRGRLPLKLVAVPDDPIPGDPAAGRAIVGGQVTLGQQTVSLTSLGEPGAALPQPMADHLQSFAWLRDLAAAAGRDVAQGIAERAVRDWLAAHSKQIAEAAWRPDLWGRRILFWTAYAPLVLGSDDSGYRSQVLNALARGARHLDRSADKTAQGVPRIAAWAGVIAAGLLIPGGERRTLRGEAGLQRALAQSLYEDGGLADRSPVSQLELVELLAQLNAVYRIAGRTLPQPIANAVAGAVPALLCVTLGDGALSSWQGGLPIRAARVEAAIAASGVERRPLAQARDWGYQHLTLGKTQLVMDAAPPPVSRLASGACASTLAFELSDGPNRLVVNCGGARAPSGLPKDFTEALRTTAAHSTLILADSNSTAVHPDGTLGRGVGEVELDRREVEGATRIEAAHDGYVRRYGFKHRRQLQLSTDGRELHGDDLLLPAGKRRPATADFVVRFHLAPGVEVSSTADGQGALLRIAGGQLWQFRTRGGALSTEESVWIDTDGKPRPSRQLVVAAETSLTGAGISWLLRRAN